MLPYLVTGAVSCALLLWAEHARDGWGRRVAPVFKTLAALSFVGLGARGAPFAPAGVALFTGLCMAAAGDVLLIKRGTGALFKLGLGAFLLGHVAYVVAFLLSGGASPWLLAPALPLLGAAALVGRWLLDKVPPKLRAPVVAYLVVITLMVAAAAARALTGADRGLWILAAALAFWLSDLFVARQRFVEPRYVNKLVGLPLYFGAQLALAASLW